jgi:leader peptidase (prepilin peptidase)/N-methyltransferase
MSAGGTALAFALGAVLGSFANVLIHRLPRRQSVIAPGSHCPACAAPIAALDNIPILSFLLLGGRCRCCRTAISSRYLIVESAMGGGAVALVARFGPTLEMIRFALLAFLLLVAVWTDVEHRIIPNAVTYPGIALGLLCSALVGDGHSAFLASCGTAAVLLGVVLGSRGGMGGGDVKLAAMIGAFLGGAAAIVALCCAVALGAAAGLVLIALRLRNGKQTIPFGPALAAGALIAVFAGHDLVRWCVARVW